ncbi:hypothetical protein AJ80_02242 [Polytolypa hystricis UAMH7299]|uniref:Uncharacterized protein n=1 Tax=Polytolypa hystricis (strain UAMH7299) TaxID=1447883 RepID=A0A2B7YPP4_POLH7|nr:hypothetical protein AJ80_02242 [Polytolypa hystricis UAMH7299]
MAKNGKQNQYLQDYDEFDTSLMTTTTTLGLAAYLLDVDFSTQSEHIKIALRGGDLGLEV